MSQLPPLSPIPPLPASSDALRAQFLLWMGSRPMAPMDASLALLLAREPQLSAKLFEAACAEGPALACDVAKAWAAAAPRALPSSGCEFPAAQIAAEAWARALAKGGDASEAWSASGASAARLAHALESLLTAPDFESRAAARFEERLAKCLRGGPRRDDLLAAEAWARAAGLHSAPLRGRELASGQLPMEAALANPASWQAAAMLARLGARCPPAWLPRVKAAMNAAMREAGCGDCPERVRAVAALAASCGAGLTTWRDQHGHRLERLASHAALTWPNASLASELALAGMRWSGSALAGAPMTALRAIKAEPQAAYSMEAKLEAICAAGGGSFGPFSRPWALLAARLGSPPRSLQPAPTAAWGPAFARWGCASGWAERDWAALAKAWPALAAEPSFACAADACALRASVPAPAEAAKPPKRSL